MDLKLPNIYFYNLAIMETKNAKMHFAYMKNYYFSE